MSYKFKVTCKRNLGPIKIGDTAIVESTNPLRPVPNDIKKGFDKNVSIGSASTWFSWERLK